MQPDREVGQRGQLESDTGHLSVVHAQRAGGKHRRQGGKMSLLHLWPRTNSAKGIQSVSEAELVTRQGLPLAQGPGMEES